MKATVLYTSADASLQSGAFRSLLYMTTGVRDRGIRPVIVTSTEDSASTSPIIKDPQLTYFIQLPRARRNRSLGYYLRYVRQNISAVLQLRAIIRHEEVDIVHANEILDFYAAVAAKLAGVPCVWHVRASFPHDSLYRRLLPRLAHHLGSRIIVVSNSVREDLFCQYGSDTRKIRVLHNPGPDPGQFHPHLDGSRIRKEFNLQPGQPLVVLVAKLIADKGHETFISSVPLVVQHWPTARFMVVGGALPGEHHEAYARALRSMPRELGVEDNIIFAGFRPDVPSIMAASDLVVHCSTYPDPFPGVVLQGMATGKAVIATNLGGTREQIEDNVSGVLIEPGHPDLLAQTIIELLSNDERRLSLGRVAAERVRDRFTTDQFFSDLQEIYEEVLAPPR